MSNYFAKSTTFGKHVEDIKYVSYFRTTVVRNNLHFHKQAFLSKYMAVVFKMRAENACKSSRKVLFTQFNLKNIWNVQKIWVNLPNIKFNENPFTGPIVKQFCVDKRTERHSEGMRKLLKQNA